MSALHQVCARALRGTLDAFDEDAAAFLEMGDLADALTAVAVRVVVAEATRSIEALPLPPAQGFGGQTMRRYVLAALEQLGKDDACDPTIEHELVDWPPNPRSGE